MATPYETYSPFDAHVDVDSTGEVVVPDDFAQFPRLHPGALDRELRQEHGCFTPENLALKDVQVGLPIDQQPEVKQLDAIATQEAIQLAKDAIDGMRRHSIEARSHADVNLKRMQAKSDVG